MVIPFYHHFIKHGKYYVKLTLKTMTLGDSNDVDHLILGKDSSNWDLLLKMVSGKVNLVGDRTSIELDFHNVSLLLPELKQIFTKRYF